MVVLLCPTTAIEFARFSLRTSEHYPEGLRRRLGVLENEGRGRLMGEKRASKLARRASDGRRRDKECGGVVARWRRRSMERRRRGETERQRGRTDGEVWLWTADMQTRTHPHRITDHKQPSPHLHSRFAENQDTNVGKIGSTEETGGRGRGRGTRLVCL